MRPCPSADRQRAVAARGGVTAAAVVAALTVGLVVGLAPSAAANGAGPPSTSYRSTVTTAPEGIDAQVLGGDAYMAIAAEPGVEVEVLGYDGEPYLRIDADGVVWRNTRSPAAYLNQERYGEADGAQPPAEAHPDAAPAWERVADGGEYAWHDHRIHWMSPEAPPATEGASAPVELFEWTVPVQVAGESGEVGGQLHWLPGDGPWGWLAAAGLVAGAGLWAARRAPQAVSAIAAATTAGLALVLLGAELSAHVAGRGFPGAWYLGLIAAVGLVALGVAVWRGAGIEGAAVLAVLGGGVLVLLRAPALWRPVVPGPWEATVTRGLAAAALAAAVVAVAAAVLAPPRPELGGDADAPAAGERGDSGRPARG